MVFLPSHFFEKHKNAMKGQVALVDEHDCFEKVRALASFIFRFREKHVKGGVFIHFTAMSAQ